MSSSSHLLRAMMWMLWERNELFVLFCCGFCFHTYSFVEFSFIVDFRILNAFNACTMYMIHFYVNMRGVCLCLWYTLILLSLFEWLCNWFYWHPTFNNGHIYFRYNFYAAQIQIFVLFHCVYFDFSSFRTHPKSKE